MLGVLVIIWFLKVFKRPKLWRGRGGRLFLMERRWNLEKGEARNLWGVWLASGEFGEGGLAGGPRLEKRAHRSSAKGCDVMGTTSLRMHSAWFAVW